MARKTFDVVDVIQILVHWQAGRNNSEIAASLGVDRKTARKYVAAAEAAGIRPGRLPLSEAELDVRVREWFPELADIRLRQVTWQAIKPHHEYIRAQLQSGVTVTRIHRRLREKHGVAVSIASFRRYVQAGLRDSASTR
jgi:predicted transcriptional regulator